MGWAPCIVPINPDYRHDELAYLLDHSEVELAVVLPHRVADVAKCRGRARQTAAGVNALALPADLPHPCSGTALRRAGSR